MSEEGARSRHLIEVGEVKTRGMKELGRGEEIVDREQTFVIPTRVLPDLKVWVRSLEGVLEVGWESLKGELLRQSGVLGGISRGGRSWGGDQSVVGSLVV